MATAPSGLGMLLKTIGMDPEQITKSIEAIGANMLEIRNGVADCQARLARIEAGMKPGETNEQSTVSAESQIGGENKADR